MSTDAIASLLARLASGSFVVHRDEPLPDDAATRPRLVRPRAGTLRWTPAPSYAAFLALASSLRCLDDDGRGLEIFSRRDLGPRNTRFVHLPDGVSRGDGRILTTNHLVGFASAHGDAIWCFDVSAPDARGEHAVYYHHEDAARARFAATGAWEDPRPPEFPDFTAWLAAHVDVLLADTPPAWWHDLGIPTFWQQHALG